MKRRNFFTGAVAGVAASIAGVLGLRKPAEAKQPVKQIVGRPRIVCESESFGFGKITDVWFDNNRKLWLAWIEGCDWGQRVWTYRNQAESWALLDQTVLLGFRPYHPSDPPGSQRQIIAIAKDGAEIVSREDEAEAQAVCHFGVDMASGQDSHHRVLVDRDGRCVPFTG